MCPMVIKVLWLVYLEFSASIQYMEGVVSAHLYAYPNFDMITGLWFLLVGHCVGHGHLEGQYWYLF